MGWLVALVILTALALLPIGVSVLYNEDGFFLRCLVGWVPISLIGKKEKEKKPKKNKEKKAEDKKRSKKKKSQSKNDHKEKKGGSVTDFLPLVKIGLDFLNAFRRKLRIRRLEMKLIMAGDDPCDLAVNYGRAWAALGNLMPQLERCFIIQKRDLEVECDFETTQTLIKARVDIVISFGGLLWIALRYGLQAVIKLIKILNLRKGGASK